MYRKTIKDKISCCGNGVYSGKKVEVILEPNDCEYVRIFRDDLNDNKPIIVNKNAFYYTDKLNTTISDGNKEVKMIEHLMATLYCFGITDIDIHVNCDEIPMFDGSAYNWFFLLQNVGFKQFEKEANVRHIKDSFKVFDDFCSIEVKPCDFLKIQYTIDFEEKYIGNDTFLFNANVDSFERELSLARTFTPERFLDKHISLKKGFNKKDIVIFGKDSFTSYDGKLRYKNEPTRHKILDFIGDLQTFGEPIIGEFICNKSGHAMNRKMINEIENYLV